MGFSKVNDIKYEFNPYTKSLMNTTVIKYCNKHLLKDKKFDEI